LNWQRQISLSPRSHKLSCSRKECIFCSKPWEWLRGCRNSSPKILIRVIWKCQRTLTPSLTTLSNYWKSFLGTHLEAGSTTQLLTICWIDWKIETKACMYKLAMKFSNMQIYNPCNLWFHWVATIKQPLSKCIAFWIIVCLPNLSNNYEKMLPQIISLQLSLNKDHIWKTSKEFIWMLISLPFRKVGMELYLRAPKSTPIQDLFYQSHSVHKEIH
jgi:hypothetical protein